jgi:hypothetical protein
MFAEPADRLGIAAIANEKIIAIGQNDFPSSSRI